MTPNQRLRLLGEGRLLQIQPTQVSDSGRYLCVAGNVAGEDDQDFSVLIQGAWGPLGTGGATAGRGGMSVLLEQSGRRTLPGGFFPFSLLAGMSYLPPGPWPRALPLTDSMTWGHHCPPPGLGFTLVKCGSSAQGASRALTTSESQ